MTTSENPYTSAQDPAISPQQPENRQRGRRSAAAAATLRVVPAAMRSLEPPGRLSAEEKKLWRDITAKLKPGWFFASEPLLETYVSVLVQQRQLAAAIRATKIGSKQYCQLMRLQRGVIGLIGMLATRLRLTPRSSVSRTAPKLVPHGTKPWDTGDED